MQDPSSPWPLQVGGQVQQWVEVREEGHHARVGVGKGRQRGLWLTVRRVSS
jgi:hypothetical protein